MGDGGMDDGTMEEGGIEGGGFFSTTLTLIRLLPSFSNQSMYSLNKDMLPVKRGWEDSITSSTSSILTGVSFSF